jgi:hypothetical protein
MLSYGFDHIMFDAGDGLTMAFLTALAFETVRFDDRAVDTMSAAPTNSV